MTTLNSIILSTAGAPITAGGIVDLGGINWRFKTDTSGWLAGADVNVPRGCTLELSISGGSADMVWVVNGADHPVPEGDGISKPRVVVKCEAGSVIGLRNDGEAQMPELVVGIREALLPTGADIEDIVSDTLYDELFNQLDARAGELVSNLYDDAQYVLTFLDQIDLEGRVNGFINDQNLRLDIDTATADINALETSVTSQFQAVNSNLSQNYYTIAQVDGAVSAIETDLSTQIGAVSSNLSQNYYTISQVNSAVSAVETSLSAQINSVSANLSQNYYTITEVDGALSAIQTSLNAQISGVESDLDQNYYTIAETDAAISAIETSLNSQYSSLSANLSNNYFTAAQTNSAISGATTSLSTRIDGNEASINQAAASIDGVKATYSVTVNNNGVMTGFGLTSDIIDGNPTSSFVVAVDEFAVAHQNGSSVTTPFYISGGVVYIKTAVIEDLSVGTLKIANQAVDVDKLAPSAATDMFSALGGGGAKQIAVTNNTGGTAEYIVLAFIDAEDTSTSPSCGVQLYKGNSSGGTDVHLQTATEVGPDTSPSQNTVRINTTVVARTVMYDGQTRYFRAVPFGDNITKLDLIVFQRHR